MLVLRTTSDTPRQARGGVYAIGNFDGVHRGHKALLRTVRDLAAETGAASGVLTFEPHPRQFFQPDAPHFRLTPLAEKLRLIAAEGIDVMAVLPFDAALSSLSADDFVDRILVCDLAVTHVVVGYHFHYGRKRGGSPETLLASGRRNGFGVTVVTAQAEQGEVFSSSKVRAFVADGDVAAAARQLGHWWRISGVVEAGYKLGTDLGFPTANIALDPGVELAHGIYAVRVIIDGQVHQGAAYYGGRPTVNTGAPRLEVFILDFSGDLYGRSIGVEFVAHLRGDMAFDGLDSLKAQIARDCEAARDVLSRTREQPVPEDHRVSCS